MEVSAFGFPTEDLRADPHSKTAVRKVVGTKPFTKDRMLSRRERGQAQRRQGHRDLQHLFYVCIGYWSQLGEFLTEVVSNHLKGCFQSVGRGSVWPFEVPAGTVMAVFPYRGGVVTIM